MAKGGMGRRCFSVSLKEAAKYFQAVPIPTRLTSNQQPTIGSLRMDALRPQTDCA